jgi:hypothetical protein
MRQLLQSSTMSSYFSEGNFLISTEFSRVIALISLSYNRVIVPPNCVVSIELF